MPSTLNPRIFDAASDSERNAEAARARRRGRFVGEIRDRGHPLCCTVARCTSRHRRSARWRTPRGHFPRSSAQSDVPLSFSHACDGNIKESTTVTLSSIRYLDDYNDNTRRNLFRRLRIPRWGRESVASARRLEKLTNERNACENNVPKRV